MTEMKSKNKIAETWPGAVIVWRKSAGASIPVVRGKEL
jgi:hypothetical protein